MKRNVCVLVVGLVLLSAALMPVWAAQESAPSSTAIGIVDLGRLNQEYQGIVQLNDQFQEFQQQQDAKLRERLKTRMLSDDEQREYMDLASMGAPTEANKERMTELAKLSDDREQKLGELEKKAARTPDEQKDYDNLNKIYSTRMAELTKLQADVEQAKAAKRDELMKVIDDSVNGAIRVIAEQKKLSVVLAKEAVRFGGVDITDDVLKKLNSSPLPKVPADTLTPAPGASTTPAAGTPTPVPATPTPAPAAKTAPAK